MGAGEVGAGYGVGLVPGVRGQGPGGLDVLEGRNSGEATNQKAALLLLPPPFAFT